MSDLLYSNINGQNIYYTQYEKDNSMINEYEIFHLSNWIDNEIKPFSKTTQIDKYHNIDTIRFIAEYELCICISNYNLKILLAEKGIKSDFSYGGKIRITPKYYISSKFYLKKFSRSYFV